MDFVRRAKAVTIGVCAAMVVGLGAGAASGPVHAASVDDWTQLASEVAGGASYDEFGDSVALSGDGTIMAVGAVGAGSYAGQIRAYGYVSGTWTQLGSDINGDANGDRLGYSVALSADGTIMAVGAVGAGSWAGLVRVFQFGSGAWTQLGADITGLASNDQFGTSLALSADGTTLAVGAPSKDSSPTTRVGQVRAFQFASGSWRQLGSDIDGTATNDWLGTSVALSSDGTVMAVGVPSSGANLNRVQVFELVATSWTQVGTDITAAAGGHFGWSVALSTDGTIVAVGADGVSASAGQVQVFQLVSGSWAQLGADIDGTTAGDSFGYSIAMSANGTTVAIGAITANSRAGQVQVFQLVSGSWTQLGADLAGVAGDWAGWSVALSADGGTVAMGVPYATSGAYTDNGVVRVYAWPTGSVSGSVSTVTVQLRFFLPDGRECTSISPVTVTVGSTYALPGTDALCRTMPGATVAGWTIPTPPGSTEFGSRAEPFPVGQPVRVVDSQRFTVVPLEPTLAFRYDSNVDVSDACASNDTPHSSDDGRIRQIWVPRTDTTLAAFPTSASCTPPGHALMGWSTAGDSGGISYAPGSSLPASWADDSTNARTFYAQWVSR